MARHGSGRAGRWPVQLRFATQSITGEEYVTSRVWERARIQCCPLHPQGGCGFAAHGTYARVDPPGTRIRRWYCRLAGVTFSALPDCLCARLSGTLHKVEREVLRVESAGSLAAAVRQARCEIELPGALRYFGRRVRSIHQALQAIKGLVPQTFAASLATVTDFAHALELGSADIESSRPTDPVLVRLRQRVWPYLAALPTPLGLNPAPNKAGQPMAGPQHRTGADRPVVVVDPPGCPGQSP